VTIICNSFTLCNSLIIKWWLVSFRRGGKWHLDIKWLTGQVARKWWKLEKGCLSLQPFYFHRPTVACAGNIQQKQWQLWKVEGWVCSLTLRHPVPFTTLATITAIVFPLYLCQWQKQQWKNVLIPMCSPVWALVDLISWFMLCSSPHSKQLIFLSAFTFNSQHSMPVAVLLLSCQTKEREK
jgi:hypothetical protein